MSNFNFITCGFIFLTAFIVLITVPAHAAGTSTRSTIDRTETFQNMNTQVDALKQLLQAVVSDATTTKLFTVKPFSKVVIEGGNSAPIARVTFEKPKEPMSILLTHLDFFPLGVGTVDEPWEAFRKLHVKFGGATSSVKASLDLSDATKWQKNVSQDGKVFYRIKAFSGNLPVPMQVPFEFTVSAETSLSASDGRWMIGIPNNGVLAQTKTGGVKRYSDAKRYAIFNVKKRAVPVVEAFFENGTSRAIAPNVGRFDLKFEVTANDTDIYLPTSGSAYGLNITRNDFTIVPRTLSYSVSGTADKENGQFVIGEGETETITITTVFTAEQSGKYRVRLNSLPYQTAAASPQKSSLPLDSGEFKTNELVLTPTTTATVNNKITTFIGAATGTVSVQSYATQALALSGCMTIANNPVYRGVAFRCVWQGKEIFKRAAIVTSSTELNIRPATNNPLPTGYVVESGELTQDIQLLNATLEPSVDTVNLEKVVIRIDTGTAVTSTVVNTVKLVIDGVAFSAKPVIDDGSPTGPDSIPVDVKGVSMWYEFDLAGKVALDEGDEVPLAVLVDLKDGDMYPSNTTIRASISATELSFWRAKDTTTSLKSKQFKGQAIGNIHSLIKNIYIDGFEADEVTLGSDDTSGEFTLEFEVTGVDNDYFISQFAGTSSVQNRGIQFSVNGPVGTGSVSASVTSSADQDSRGVYVVGEGETENFTLTVNVDPQTNGVFRVKLGKIWYSEAPNGVTNAKAYVPFPEVDFETDALFIRGQ